MTNKNISPMTAGAIGATVGAIGGVAAAAVMSNSKTRKKVDQVLSDVKQGAMEAVTEMRVTAKKQGNAGMKKLASTKKKVLKKI